MAAQLLLYSKWRNQGGLTMRRTAEVLDEVDISSLDKGSVIEVETKSRHYRIEYLGGDEAWISGHPKFMPDPCSIPN